MKPVLIVLVAGAVVLLSFVVAALLFWKFQDQRTASCRATLVALDATAETAAAGIRPIPTPLKATDVGAALATAFAKQIAAAKAENKRRAHVLAEVTVATIQLRQSDFCN